MSTSTSRRTASGDATVHRNGSGITQGLGGDAIVCALERDFDLLALDGTGALGGEWRELRAALAKVP